MARRGFNKIELDTVRNGIFVVRFAEGDNADYGVIFGCSVGHEFFGIGNGVPDCPLCKELAIAQAAHQDLRRRQTDAMNANVEPDDLISQEIPTGENPWHV